MLLTTPVDISPSPWKIMPCEKMLFVGSCFADNIGRRFQEEKFRAVVNPFGVMYNPVSVAHTIERTTEVEPAVIVITLGTNHVYREKSTGQIVDNCQKRPAILFQEEVLTTEECYDALRRVVEMTTAHIVVTVSPIRYRKYGYHGSRLSKATLLLAADRLEREFPERVTYFPAYEIMNDELRDYRFYKPDMLHPSEQAVEYIYERFAQTFFHSSTFDFLKAWRPIRDALNHRPINAESDEYKQFLLTTRSRLEALYEQYPQMERD